MAKEKENTTESVINYLRNFAGLLGLIGGVSYIAGYLISNFYIGKFGSSAFNLVQSRYFSTGGLFLILVTIILLGPVISLTIINTATKDNSRGAVFKNILLILFGFLLSAITIWYSGNILSGLNPNANFLLSTEVRRPSIWLGLTVTVIAIFSPILIIFVSRWILAQFINKKTENIPAWSGLFLGGLTIFIFIISLWLFSEFVYPFVPSSFGGNAPTKVQIILSEYLSGMEYLPLKTSNGISETVTLIDQTPTSVLIMLPDTNTVIEIPYSEIKGIIR
jgi:MFS family permease